VRLVVALVAVAVVGVAVEVRAAELPPQRTVLDLLGAEREAQPAADGLADVQAGLAVDGRADGSLVVEADRDVDVAGGLRADRVDRGDQLLRLDDLALDQ
jgi:hypothetical protein